VSRCETDYDPFDELHEDVAARRQSEDSAADFKDRVFLEEVTAAWEKQHLETPPAKSEREKLEAIEAVVGVRVSRETLSSTGRK
jgi:hypothetical protein